MVNGEYHWRYGTTFRRTADGSVQIVANHNGIWPAIPPNEWASIVAFVSAMDDDATAFAAATKLHG